MHSKKENEIVFDERTDSDIVSSIFAKKNFDNDLPEIKRFVGHLKPMSFTKNWYSRPTPPDMQFEERVFQTQFSVSVKKIFDDDLPEIKRFVGNPKPMSFTKNWYSRPTLPNM